MGLSVTFGILIPFIGTSLGAAFVFFMKKQLGRSVQRALTGFAAGIMTAASVWSLLIPAIEQSSSMGALSFVPAVTGFWIGTLFLLILDKTIPHLHMFADKAEGHKSKLAKTTMLLLAVTLHNIPEGMAVGVIYAGLISGSAEISAGSAGARSGNSNTKCSRGSYNFYAASRRGKKQDFFVLRRRAVGSGRADRRIDNNFGFRADGSRDAVFAQLCGRCYDLCGSRGAYPRNVTGRTFQCRCYYVCRRLYPDDGAGCGVGIKLNIMKPDYKS